MMRFSRLVLCAVAALLVIPVPALAQGTPSVDDPQAIAQAVIDNLIAGDFEAAAENFDEAMLAALPPAVLEQTWGQLEQQAGAFESLGDEVTSQVQGDLTTYFFALQFEKLTLEALVTVNTGGQVAGLYFRPLEAVQAAATPEYEPPVYADSAAFEERDVTLNAGSDRDLPGTLTVPVGEGPFPVVVLVHGSGPNDRDETVGSNKPFRDLAWGLASQGIAVLRYDKRTLVYAAQMAADPNLTVAAETVDDAVAAVDLLRQTEGIDPDQIYVLGHSQGGYLAPRIAAQAGDLAGVIILAGNTRPLPDLVAEQTEYLLTIDDGTFSDEDQAYLDSTLEVVEATKAAQPDDDPATLLFHTPPAYWIDLNAYDPLAAVQDVAAPLLILQGERDYQVTLDDLAGWQSALEGRDDVTFKTYADLNHLFLSGEGDPNPAEYQQPGHVAEAVINDIAGWITAQS